MLFDVIGSLLDTLDRNRERGLISEEEYDAEAQALIEGQEGYKEWVASRS